MDRDEDRGPYVENGLVYWPAAYDAKPLTLPEIVEELADYSHLLREVPVVYEAVTGGQMSKPNYYARDVISAFEEYLDKVVAAETNADSASRRTRERSS